VVCECAVGARDPAVARLPYGSGKVCSRDLFSYWRDSEKVFGRLDKLLDIWGQVSARGVDARIH
jgi:hypothetical protein